MVIAGYTVTVTCDDDANVAAYVEAYLEANRILVEYEIHRKERVMYEYSTTDVPGLT